MRHVRVLLETRMLPLLPNFLIGDGDGRASPDRVPQILGFHAVWLPSLPVCYEQFREPYVRPDSRFCG